MIGFPAMRRLTILALLVALVAIPGVATAAPVEALPPAKPRAITEITPGLGYQRVVQASGQVVHVLRAARTPRLSVAPSLTAGSPVSRVPLTDAVVARLNAGVVAGVNGDFFSFDTGDPSGVLMIGEDLVHEPEAARPSLLISADEALGSAMLVLQGRFQAIDPTGVRRYAVRAFGGINRPAKRGSETILYTPSFGEATTPAGGSRYEVRVQLAQPGPLVPNLARTGTVVATGSGGGMAIGAGYVVLTGVGSSGVPLAAELPVGQQVTLTPGLLGLPAGVPDAIGGGPTLVSGGQPISSYPAGYTLAQVGSRTSRTAIGQTAQGTILLVTAEGPSQGSPGITAIEQAKLMQSLGAQTAFAMDAGGSAQMAVGGDLVIPWSSPRSIPDALLVSYSGVTLQPLPFRLSANADRVDDRATAVVRSPAPGVAKVTIAKRSGRPAKRLWEGRLGPGAVKVGINPRTLRLGDGVYYVVARFTPDDGSGETQQRRRVILDRTLSSLTARPQSRRVGRRVEARVDVGFRLLRPARVTVRVLSESGAPLRTLTSGRPLRPGRHTIAWDRTVRRKVVSGDVEISVQARSRFGTSGLVRDMTLKPVPRPRPARP